MDESQPEVSEDFDEDLVAYSPAWGVAASFLEAFARGSLLVMLAALFLSENPPTNPLRQMRLFLGFFAAPRIAAWCIARAFAARVHVRHGVLRIEDRREVVEVPLLSLAAVSPWKLPLHGGGLWLTLRSGRRLPRALQTKDPVGFVESMVAAGAPPDIAGGLKHPMVVFANARLAHPLGILENPIFKFVFYSLVPTLPAFRLHQYITYGGTFGEYYTFGLGAYLLAFGIWWGSWAINLTYVASAARVVVEVVSLAAVFAAPSFASAVRGVLELAQRVVFYVGIPTWLVLRLLA